jgi:hypothetical protein
MLRSNMSGRKKVARKCVKTADEDLKRRKIPKQQDPKEDEQVMIEFKFASCETHCILENELTGDLHVPMLQDPITGRCRIPPGRTSAQGIVQRAISDDTTIEEYITAEFTRNADADYPVENFTFKLGYDLEYLLEDETSTEEVVPS